MNKKQLRGTNIKAMVSGKIVKMRKTKISKLKEENTEWFYL